MKDAQEFSKERPALFLGPKVVSAAEMSRIDRLAVQSGCSEEQFIEKAGKKIALAAMESPHKHATLLIGKGNKGADAYAAGIQLAEEGYRVRALALFPPDACSAWNRKFGERFSKKGKIGRVWDGEEIQFEEGWIIDGMLGTGFKGKVEGILETAIRMANDSKRPILAIDIPSGLDGTTGAVQSVAIAADLTVSLGFAKCGCFLREGWNHTGRLIVEDFGLPPKFILLAQEIAFLPDIAKLPLPRIVRNRHKYQAGYAIGFSGSHLMRGAPKLAGLAALRTGAGIVRVFHKEEIGEAPMELICQKWSEKVFFQELKRASAVFAGPGLGSARLSWMKKIGLPIVLDADALQAGIDFPSHAVLTPHRGEMLRLLGLKSAPQEEELLGRCQKFVERKRVVLVLKGGPTFLFAHGKTPLILPRGDPGMATAGAGDVLTGILAGLLAQGLSCYEAAATGIYLHAAAGERAAREKTSYGLIARDLIEFLPNAFQELLAARHTAG